MYVEGFFFVMHCLSSSEGSLELGDISLRARTLSTGNSHKNDPGAKQPACIIPAASVGVNSSSYSSSGVYLGEESSGGAEVGLRYGEASRGGGGGGGYVVSSVSKGRSSSSVGARREQGTGSSGRVSPDFRERKAVSSRSGGYDGESCHRLSLKERKRP